MATTVDQLKLDDNVAKALYKAMAPKPNLVDGSVGAHPFGADFEHLSTKDRVARAAGYVKAKTIKDTLDKAQAFMADNARRQKEDQSEAEFTKEIDGIFQNVARNRASNQVSQAAPLLQAAGQVIPGLSAAGDAAETMQQPPPDILGQFSAAAARSGVGADRASLIAGRVLPFMMGNEPDPLRLEDLAIRKAQVGVNRDSVDLQRQRLDKETTAGEVATHDPRLKAWVKEYEEAFSDLGKASADLQATTANSPKWNDLNGRFNASKRRLRQAEERLQPKAAKPTARSPYAEGTRLQGPGGKIYIVKDGKPVPE